MQAPAQSREYHANFIFHWRQQPCIPPSQPETGPVIARISQLYANLAIIAKPVRILAAARIARDAPSTAIRLIVGKFSCAKQVYRTIRRVVHPAAEGLVLFAWAEIARRTSIVTCERVRKRLSRDR